ncbi:MAG: hypothetical protein QOH43_4371 [Solirubrobacteraceae bacterium]|nr:hypothetical protein [Solirubrobacteraceae bacterium]
MPTFCRHNRFAENCPICSKTELTRPGTVGGTASPASRRPAKPASSSAKRRTPRGGDLVVRRQARAADDGYEHELVPGLRARADAVRLAEELAFSVARLQELSSDPPGLYAEAASTEDREEALWLTFLIAYLSPQEGEEPWAAIAAARTPWGAEELPDLDTAAAGPRGSHEARRGTSVVEAYRTRADRAGSQAALLAGEASLTPQRRFDRAFERLQLGGLSRGARYEFLLTAGRLGLLDVEPWSLMFGLGEAGDKTTLAAKRVFGIGDPMNLRRRATDLAAAADVPVAALDLALVNWALPAGDRITAGATATADPEVVRRLRATLGVSAEVAEVGGDDGGDGDDDSA